MVLQQVGKGEASRCPAVINVLPLDYRSKSFHPYFLLFASSIFFLNLTDPGVTSTISSSLINSIAWLKTHNSGGTNCSASSALAARMFVSFFSLMDVSHQGHLP